MEYQHRSWYFNSDGRLLRKFYNCSLIGYITMDCITLGYFFLLPGPVMAARGYHAKHGKGDSLLRGHKHDSVVPAAPASTAAAMSADTAPATAAAAGHAAEVADVVARGTNRGVLGQYSAKNQSINRITLQQNIM